MWMLRRPRESQVIEFLLQSARKPLNYASDAELVAGRQATHFSTQIHLGNGFPAYQAAVKALHNWQMIRLAGADIFWPDRGLRQGTTLAIGMPAFGLYWLNPCRITTISESQSEDRLSGDLRAEIGWGTVDGHCLQGSELFAVRHDLETDDVWYEISSVAAPVGWLRPGRSLIDKLRKTFQLETCRQMSIALGCDNRYKRMLPAGERDQFQQRV